MGIRKEGITLSLLLFLFTACGDKPQLQEVPEPPVWDMSGFGRGADVSWLTEMEKSGFKFYHPSGREMECMQLLRELGMNAVRLRVWVNPADGWCDAGDVLVKAWRADKLDMRLMIDFHYSDSWADPSRQAKPAAWEELGGGELEKAVAAHTLEFLNLLKDNGITPEWVQVGNETGNGMLWEEGKASENMARYAALNNAGYDAVKSVFPETKVIVHLQEGNNNSLFRWLFDGLKENGGRWDVIGMSLYPTADNWEALTAECLSNVNDMISRYGTEVIICETGMHVEEAGAAKHFLTALITGLEAIADEQCLGVFYWEPQACDGWKGYEMGAFDDTGTPTAALDAFRRNE